MILALRNYNEYKFIHVGIFMSLLNNSSGPFY